MVLTGKAQFVNTTNEGCRNTICYKLIPWYFAYVYATDINKFALKGILWPIG